MRSLVYQSIFAMYFFSTCLYLFFFFFFFFQAEDGIRDADVTGVQRVLFRSRPFRAVFSGAYTYIMPPMPGTPWSWPAAGLSSGRSAIMASVVIIRPAIEPAACSAVRVTLDRKSVV